MCAECDKAAADYGLGSAVAQSVKTMYHPRPPAPHWRYLEWPAFCAWLQGRTIKAQTDAEGEARIEFDDGAVAIVQSNFESDYSELTPGAGIQPPSVKVLP